MKEFIWDNYYQIGNQKVDQQHQELFNLANGLVQSKTQEDLAENAMRLYRHVREHFQSEEAFMKSHGYLDYQKHIDTHSFMLDKLVLVSDKINKHEWQQQDVWEFMREWITHILEDDAAIKDYFLAEASKRSDIN